VGISYRKSFDIVKKIRKSTYANRIVERLKGSIEMDDEVYVTSGLKGKKPHPRRTALKERGRGTYGRDKPPTDNRARLP
jgi:hypothetical protein